jgi:hypothetical protein
MKFQNQNTMLEHFHGLLLISVSMIGFQALSNLFLENSIGALLCVCDVLVLRFGNLGILFNIWNFYKENFAIFFGFVL